MKYDRIAGIDKDISKLVMGCDNQDDINEASKLWDHWIEVGGYLLKLLLVLMWVKQYQITDYLIKI